METLEKAKILIEKGWEYNPETGDITSHTGNIIKAKASNGYLVCCLVYGKKELRINGHRFAYYYMLGRIPDMIDHINTIKNDNRWENLREATYTKNSWNRSKKPKGYSWNKAKRKWAARIRVYGKLKHLGLFSDASQAEASYEKAKIIYHDWSK
jgi:hypothetical protein